MQPLIKSLYQRTYDVVSENLKHFFQILNNILAANTTFAKMLYKLAKP